MAEPCSLFVAISGSSDAVRSHLKNLIEEMDRPYGKPVQGIYILPDSTREVITPRWNGESH